MEYEIGTKVYWYDEDGCFEGYIVDYGDTSSYFVCEDEHGDRWHVDVEDVHRA